MKRTLSRFEGKKEILLVAIYTLFLILFGIKTNFDYRLTQHQQFISQAVSLMSGKLELTPLHGINDTLDVVIVDGKKYWPQGIFPSVVLIPFIFLWNIVIRAQFFQAYLNIMLFLANYLLFYKITSLYLKSRSQKLLFVNAMMLGSITINSSLNPSSWYLVQSMALFLQLLAIYTYLAGKNKMLLIGILYAFLMTTRLTAYLTIIFFVMAELLKNKKKVSALTRSIDPKIFTKLIPLLVPSVFSLAVIMYLNKVRFGSPFDNGYIRSNIAPYFEVHMRELYGLFSIKNIPSNFYLYFLKGLTPVYQRDTYHLVYPYFFASPIGLSFFIASPLFVRMILYWKRLKNKANYLVMSSFATSAMVLLVLLSYCLSGYLTYGPRHMIDILPFLTLLLLETYKYKKFSRGDTFVCVAAPLVNIFFWQMLF